MSIADAARVRKGDGEIVDVPNVTSAPQEVHRPNSFARGQVMGRDVDARDVVVLHTRHPGESESVNSG